MRALVLLPLALVATGCARTQAQAQPGACRADAVANLVGQAITPAIEADATKRSGARTTRVVRPGQVVTMDYRTDRLNIALDAADRIESLRCG